MLRTVEHSSPDTDLLLPLNVENYQSYEASTTLEVDIKTVARILKTLGDDLNARATLTENLMAKVDTSFKEYASSGLKQVFHTIGVVCDWLEYSAKEAAGGMEMQNMQKKEGVLRGLYHIVDLGSYASFIGLLQLTHKFLKISDNPYRAKREHLSKCLTEIEGQTQQLFQLVNEAGEILTSIMNEDQFNHAKAFQFDNLVRQANDVIESCKEYLDTAFETIQELTHNMNIIKWCFRGLRLGGLLVTCYGIYHTTPSTMLDSLAGHIPSNHFNLIEKVCSNSKFDFVLKAAACTMSGYVWMSFLPSRAYTFHDSLADLKYQHIMLTNGLHKLERRLRTSKDTFDGVKKSKDN